MFQCAKKLKGVGVNGRNVAVDEHMIQQKIGIVGTGRIGACEAILASGNRFETVVVGHSERGVKACREEILRGWEDMIREGVATEKNRDAAMNLVTITDDPAWLKDCTLVFEAVSESMTAKKEAYSTITENCMTDTVIASCTSSLRVEMLADLIGNPERFVVAHPFQPVHLQPLVEVVRHEGTANWAVERVCALLRDMKRQVVTLNKSVPGFIVNRLAQALFRESIYLIESGVCSAEDIDTSVKYAIGMRYASMGLLEYFDDVGYELESAIAGNIYPDLCNITEIQPLVRHGLENGENGRKAGKGLYDWRKKDEADFLYRKQAPFFGEVLKWNLPE